MENYELIYLPALEILHLYRERKLSPVEMLNAHIQQIERCNDKVNCIVQEHFDEAMQAARESEQRYMDGNPRPADPISPRAKDSSPSISSHGPRIALRST